MPCRGARPTDTPHLYSKPAPKWSAAYQRFLKDKDPNEHFILDKAAPLAEELFQWQPKIHQPNRVIDLVKSPPNHVDLETFLTQLTSLPKHANLVLVGNGMYPLYLIYKALLKDKPGFNKIYFLPVSDGLASKFSESFNLTEYFDFLEFDRLHGDFIVMDSVSDRIIPNMHQVLLVSRALSFYLLSRGQTEAKVAKKVIPLGIPEASRFPYPYKDPTIAKFKERLGRKEATFYQEFIPNDELRFVPSQLTFEDVDQFYSYYKSDESYWSGKYEKTDGRGFPVGNQTFSGPAAHYRRQLNLAQNFRYYMELVEQSRNDPEINQWVERASSRWH